MILAGIDEAGLGPNVGPLATACAAFRVPEGWLPESLWEKLSGVCCREWGGRGTRLGVADSKVLYTRGGLAALERTVGAFARCAGGPGFSVSGAFPDSGAVSPEAHPCYSRRLDVPGCRDAALEEALAACGAEAVRLAIGCLFEPAMNLRFASGLNKNRILLMETGARLAGLVEAFPAEPVLVVVDKQGGRNEYLPFLTSLFPGSWVETRASGAAASVYRVRRGGGGDAEIRFVAKGDRDSFPTALASMAAKYARERSMAELNAWFGARVPGLRETAGYPQDAKRWRGEVEKLADAGALLLERVWRRK